MPGHDVALWELKAAASRGRGRDTARRTSGGPRRRVTVKPDTLPSQPSSHECRRPSPRFTLEGTGNLAKFPYARSRCCVAGTQAGSIERERTGHGLMDAWPAPRTCHGKARYSPRPAELSRVPTTESMIHVRRYWKFCRIPVCPVTLLRCGKSRPPHRERGNGTRPD